MRQQAGATSARRTGTIGAAVLAALSAWGCGAPPAARETPVRVFAAASLGSVMPALAVAFEQATPGATLELNYASTSILVRQIEHGAPADVFVSASSTWMDELERRGFIDRASRADVARNTLIIVAGTGHESALADPRALASPAVARIALGDWSHVPAGIYAREAMERLGLWSRIESKCVPALDVRAALALVERGEADAGIVYRTDVGLGRSVAVAAVLPAAAQPDIRYPAARLARSHHPVAARFVTFLSSPQAVEIWRAHDFGVPGARE